jgi:hypothetical protein
MALGGHAMFLGSRDIQLGVNESLLDTSRVVSSMVDGIMARVGEHEEIEVSDAHAKQGRSYSPPCGVVISQGIQGSCHQCIISKVPSHANPRRPHDPA